MKVTLTDLRTGARARISPKEFAALRGCSEATLCRERLEGSGPNFRRDEKDRVWYDGTVVLEYFDSLPSYKSTSQYVHNGTSRMEKARAARGRDR
jgi:hypothetical protein